MNAERKGGGDDLLVRVGWHVERKGGPSVWPEGIEHAGDRMVKREELLNLGKPVSVHRDLVIHSLSEGKLVNVTQAVFAKLAARVEEPLLQLRVIKAVQLDGRGVWTGLIVGPIGVGSDGPTITVGPERDEAVPAAAAAGF